MPIGLSQHCFVTYRATEEFTLLRSLMHFLSIREPFQSAIRVYHLPLCGIANTALEIGLRFQAREIES
jgi:hypothetical protein